MIDRIPLSQVSEEHLQELVDAGVAENVMLDFKLEAYGNSDGDKRELVKDVSALANARGGDLIIGIEEVDSVAIKLEGISGDTANREVTRIESMIQNGISPRIAGISVRAVPLKTGKAAVVIRVPRSWAGPHIVTAQKENRFWIRRSNSKEMMSVEELRGSFLQGPEIGERLQRRNYSLSQQGISLSALSQRAFIFRAIPFSAVMSRNPLDLKILVAAFSGLVRPPQTSADLSYRFNAAGFLSFDRVKGDRGALLQVHRDGSMEAIRGGIQDQADDGASFMYGNSIDHALYEALPRYLTAQIELLNCLPPIAVFLSLRTEAGARMLADSPTSSRWKQQPGIPNEGVEAPEIILEDVPSDPKKLMSLMQPAVDVLWQAGGHIGSPNFDKSGEFTPVKP